MFYTLSHVPHPIVLRQLMDPWNAYMYVLCMYICMYKVVQIWPGLFVCKQVTVCPGHIWTTLYYVCIYVCVYVCMYRCTFIRLVQTEDRVDLALIPRVVVSLGTAVGTWLRHRQTVGGNLVRTNGRAVSVQTSHVTRAGAATCAAVMWCGWPRTTGQDGSHRNCDCNCMGDVNVQRWPWRQRCNWLIP